MLKKIAASVTASSAAWRALGIAGRAVPARLRDAIYDVVAAVRYRIFGTEVESCPRVSLGTTSTLAPVRSQTWRKAM